MFEYTGYGVESSRTAVQAEAIGEYAAVEADAIG